MALNGDDGLVGRFYILFIEDDVQVIISEVEGFITGDEGNIFLSSIIYKEVQVGKDQEKAQSENDSHSKIRGGKKTN